jgi:hypothetical protein
MKPVLMQNETDCEVAAIATACEVSYEQATEKSLLEKNVFPLRIKKKVL